MSYHIRRKDQEITNITVLKKILRSTKYITIALSKHNQPYLVTLSHGYDEKQNCIFFHCATEGKKLEYPQLHIDTFKKAQRKSKEKEGKGQVNWLKD